MENQLSKQLAELSERVSRLERGGQGPTRVRGSRGGGARRPGDGLVEELGQLRGRRYQRGGAGGAIVYAGRVRFGKTVDLGWIREQSVPDIAECELDRSARVLAALGHPTRLQLLRAMLGTPRTSQELQELAGQSSTGQLYHHLKDLLSAGLIEQAMRNLYQVARGHIVPLLVILAATSEFTRGADLSELPGAPAQRPARKSAAR